MLVCFFIFLSWNFTTFLAPKILLSGTFLVLLSFSVKELSRCLNSSGDSSLLKHDIKISPMFEAISFLGLAPAPECLKLAA